MADKICGDGIGNSTGRLYNAEVDLITPTTMYGSSPGEPRTLVQSVDAAGPKKKPTSFQITSVTVQGSRLSNDGGDESADDLDESHTEDLSSDILDCSKTTDAEQLSPTEENGNAATTPAPPAPAEAATEPAAAANAPSDPVPSAGLVAVTVSPAVVTGAAGTLAIVASAPAAPSATEGPINPDHWQRRFKVVKIVSTEPFGRGRWQCMDFVDPPAMQADTKAGEERESGTAAADLPPAVSNEAVAHVYEIPVGQTVNNQQGGPLYGIILPVSAGGQGSPLGVLQPIAEQQASEHAAAPAPGAPVPEAPSDAPAAHAETMPENANKSATEEDSERFVPTLFVKASRNFASRRSRRHDSSEPTAAAPPMRSAATCASPPDNVWLDRRVGKCLLATRGSWGLVFCCHFLLLVHWCGSSCSKLAMRCTPDLLTPPPPFRVHVPLKWYP